MDEMLLRMDKDGVMHLVEDEYSVEINFGAEDEMNEFTAFAQSGKLMEAFKEWKSEL